MITKYDYLSQKTYSNDFLEKKNIIFIDGIINNPRINIVGIFSDKHLPVSYSNFGEIMLFNF